MCHCERQHMRVKTLLFLAATCLIFIGIATAGTDPDQKKGAPEIRLDGGNKGPVDFPHQKHQQTLGDCSICHTIFPQTTGIIRDLKNQAKLKPKQVMNHCRQCHRSMAAAGKHAGPTSCRKCHRK
jgi:uncharacterized membrane protein